MEQSYKSAIQEIDTQIVKVKETIEGINKLMSPYVCPDYKGSGERYITDAAGSRDTDVCLTCKGSGIKIK